jgi:hypothetical protein
MNDFERKLAAQPFREPPADLRRTILAACEPTPRGGWREWLWPAPAAWAALAALWLAFFAVDAAERLAGPAAIQVSPAVILTEDMLRSSPLLTAHSPQALRHALEFTR